jgi:Predicted Rossmann fold nucleotide-binding protein involved in DNA uptake
VVRLSQRRRRWNKVARLRVPGHINAPSAMGSNRLIQQGAKLVMDASDILEDLEICCLRQNRLPKPQPGRCRRFQTRSAESMNRFHATETSIDDIAARSELPSAAVSSTLLQLELKRLVKQLPGKYFVKLG